MTTRGAAAAAEVRRWLDRPVVTIIDADGPDLRPPGKNRHGAAVRQKAQP